MEMLHGILLLYIVVEYLIRSTSGFKVKSLIAAGVSQLLSAANIYLISWVRAAQHQRGDPGSLPSQRAVQHHRTGSKSSHSKLVVSSETQRACNTIREGPVKTS